MALVDDLGDELAREVLAALDELGDDRFYEKIARSVGALSPTLQEAFMTSIRLRLAQQRGQRALAEALAAVRAGESVAEPAPAASPAASSATTPVRPQRPRSGA